MLRPAKNGLLSVRVGVSNGISFLALLGDSVRLLSAIGTTIGRVMPYKLLLTGEFERAPHALCCMGDRVAAGARAVGAARVLGRKKGEATHANERRRMRNSPPQNQKYSEVQSFGARCVGGQNDARSDTMYGFIHMYVQCGTRARVCVGIYVPRC